MPQIEFIQYLPNNLRKRVMVDRPEDIDAKASDLRKAGFRFECKQHGDGKVTVAVADPVMDFILASRTVEDGPQVSEAVDGLINDVHAVLEERNRRHAAKVLT